MNEAECAGVTGELSCRDIRSVGSLRVELHEV